MMAASCHAERSNEREKLATKILFLALLLNPEEGSPIVVGAGSSKSNLFFSNLYGSSAEPKFGLKLRKPPY
jgi:hypothetical protein